MRGNDRTLVLVACTAAFFVTFFARLSISPVIPFISEDFQVSNATIGLALSGMWLAYGLAQYPSGILGDRFGEKRIILLAVGGTTLAALLLAWSPLFAMFAICVFALGGMAGLHYSPATTLLARVFDNTGRAIGVHLLGAPAAGLTAPVVAAWVGERYGWRPAIATTIIVGVPTYVLVVRAVSRAAPRRPDEPIRGRLREGAGSAVLLRPAILFTLVIAMLGTFVIQGLLSFLPTFLVEHHAYSTALAGVGFSAFFVLRAISQFVLGMISDAYGRDFGIAVAMLTGAVGLTSLVFAPGDLGIAIGLGLAGFGMGFFAVTDPRFLDILTADEQGSGFGFVRTIYVMFGAAGSVSVGFVADVFGWDVSFLLLAGMLGFAFLVVLANDALDLGY